MKSINNTTKIIMYIILVILCVVVILPYLWVIGSSLSHTGLGYTTGGGLSAFIPERPTVDNYVALFTKVNMLRVLFNTIFVALAVSMISVVVNSMAAYALAKLHVVGKNLIFGMILGTMFVPFELLIIPMYQVVRTFHLIDTYGGLIIPATASAFGVFFFRQFFLDTPESLDDAARMDGAGLFRTYWQITLPLLKAPMVTIGILTFVQQWDNFLWALTVTNKEEMKVLQVALTYLSSVSEHVTNWGNVFSGVVLAALPMVVLYLFLQRYIVQSTATVGITG